MAHLLDKQNSISIDLSLNQWSSDSQWVRGNWTAIYTGTHSLAKKLWRIKYEWVVQSFSVQTFQDKNSNANQFIAHCLIPQDAWDSDIINKYVSISWGITWLLLQGKDINIENKNSLVHK